MRIKKVATVSTLGVTVSGVALAALVTAATSSSAASTRATTVARSKVAAAQPAHRAVAHVAVARPTAQARRSTAASTDVTVTSREQVAWTLRAQADTTPVANQCTPITGADGEPIEAGGGGFVYAAQVDDAQDEADIAAMYTAMAAGDQAAYDAAYHRLDLHTNCN